MALPLSGAGRLILPATAALLAVALGVLAGREPAAAIAAALAIGFTLVTLANLYVGLVLFTGLAFIVEIPGLTGTGLSFAKAGGLLLTISWLATVTTRGDARADFPRAHPGATLAVLMLLAWIGLSQLWADNVGDAREVLLRLALNVVLALVIFTAIRQPRQAIVFTAAFVAGATVNAVYGLLFVEPEGTEQATRLASGIANPNELATILVASLVLAIGLWLISRGSPVRRLLLSGAAAVCTAGIFLTGSRGGLVALAVALLAFLLTGSRFRGRLLLVLAAIVIAATGYYNYVASEQARERISEIDSGSGRTDLWAVGWRMVEAEPIRGVGGGNFETASPRYLLQPGVIERADLFIGRKPKAAHNSYLEIWAELGVVGLGLFLFVVGFGLSSGFKASRRFAELGDLRMEILSRTVFVAFAAVLAADFFGSRQYDKELWILLGLSAALWAIARTSEAVADG